LNMTVQLSNPANTVKFCNSILGKWFHAYGREPHVVPSGVT